VPEGDTLHRLATRLRPALLGKTVLELRLPRTELGTVDRLVGRTVTSVESKGKNLLIGFDDGSALHTHLRMTGIWHLYPEGAPWRRGPTWVVAVLRVPGFTAVCFRAPVVRLLRPGAVEHDPRLRALGPDLLDAEVDVEEAVRRLRARDALPLGVAVMDQQALAGIGNVYKSEILFLRRLDPFAPVAVYGDDELRAVVELGVELLRKNVRDTASHAIRTTRIGGLPGQGAVHVYGRSGRHCFVCGATIRMARQGAQRRSTYYCPFCQPDRRVPA
jgi:endonuclease-8